MKRILLFCTGVSLIAASSCSAFRPQPRLDRFRDFVAAEHQQQTRVFAADPTEGKILYALKGETPEIWLYATRERATQRVVSARRLESVDKITWENGAFRVWENGRPVVRVVVD